MYPPPNVFQPKLYFYPSNKNLTFLFKYSSAKATRRGKNVISRVRVKVMSIFVCKFFKRTFNCFNIFFRRCFSLYSLNTLIAFFNPAFPSYYPNFSPLTPHFSLLLPHLSPLTFHFSLLTSHFLLLISHFTFSFSPLTSHFLLLTSHLSPLTFNYNPQTASFLLVISLM